MERSRRLFVGLVLIGFACDAVQAVEFDRESSFNAIQRLTDDLFKNYAVEVRPVADHLKSVNVTMGASLVEVNIDDIFSTMGVNLWLRLVWTDERFKWNPAEYENLSVLRVPSENIWRPDILLYNSAFESERDIPSLTKAVIYSDGKVLWAPPLSYNAFCKLDFRSWPRDTQNCSLRFGSWTHDGYQISYDLYNGEEEVDLHYLAQTNSQWQVVSTNASVVSTTYDCCPEPYPSVYFNFILKRQSCFYTATIIIPAIVVVALALASFIIPPNRGAKFNFGLTNILVLIAYMFYFSTQLPAMGGNVPTIVAFYRDTLLLVAFSLVTSAIFMWWTTSPSASSPPQVIMKLLTGRCGHLLGLRSIIAIVSTNCNPLAHQFDMEGPGLLTGDNEKGRGSEEPSFGPVAKKPNTEEIHLEWLLLACSIDRILMVVYSILLGTLLATCF